MKNKNSFLNRIWKEKFQTEFFKDLKSEIRKERQHQADENIFFNPQYEDLFSPWDLKDMKKAVLRISKAIKNKERIMIYGDFDADGVTSTVILVDGLKKLGAQVSYRIPDREKDSHGLKKNIIDEIAETKTDLIISCDCGINDQEEVNYAVSKGIDIIITDHHHPKKEFFPDQAIAVINPQQENCKYPEKNLSGAGVAFKIIMALYENILEEKPPQEWMDRYLEIATIGQIADCMPLKGEIRTMSKLGLKALENSKWQSLKNFLREEKINEVTSETIGFCIAPRINAASRVGDVLHAVQFFLHEETYKERLEHLNYLNGCRKILTEEALEEAHLNLDLESEVLWIHLPNVKTGILGLVASRFVEKEEKPVIVSNEEEDFIHASVRAPKGCDLMKILEPIEYIFDRFGGHKGAAGFRASKEKEDLLRKKIKNLKSYKEKNLTLEIESFIAPKDLDLKCLDFHEELAPFGMGNPDPRYGIKNVKIENVNFLGKTQDHIRINFVHENKPYNTVGFFLAHFLPQIDISKKYDLVVEVSKNSWNGNTSAQMRIIDIRETYF